MLEVYESASYPVVPTIAQPELRNGIMQPQINGSTEISEGTIFANALVVGQQTWIHNLTWTVTDYNTVSWSSGTLQLRGGSSFSIDAGNTGNISGTTYIYFNGTTTLQTTTTYSTAVADNNILLATVSPASDTAAKAIFTPYNSPGTTINGNQITTGKVQSTDGKTYFDLDGKELVVNDGTNNRVHLGYQSGGY